MEENLGELANVVGAPHEALAPGRVVRAKGGEVASALELGGDGPVRSKNARVARAISRVKSARGTCTGPST